MVSLQSSMCVYSLTDFAKVAGSTGIKDLFVQRQMFSTAVSCGARVASPKPATANVLQAGSPCRKIPISPAKKVDARAGDMPLFAHRMLSSSQTSRPVQPRLLVTSFLVVFRSIQISITYSNSVWLVVLEVSLNLAECRGDKHPRLCISEANTEPISTACATQT
jgi:hypothetical protein